MPLWCEKQVGSILKCKVETNPPENGHWCGIEKKKNLPVKSCHHPLWLRNIPKEQIIRLKRNCSNDSDYSSQEAQIAKEKFVDKGYNAQFLDTIVEQVALVPRENCLKDDVVPRVLPARNGASLQDFTHNIGKLNQYLHPIGTYYC